MQFDRALTEYLINRSQRDEQRSGADGTLGMSSFAAPRLLADHDFVNVSLLFGSALIAVPIVLHLIMRRKPVRLEFPALRFIQKRHDVNQRRLQLRHLLLLLLRAAAIALLAFALARPSVKIKFAGVLGSQESPVAAALVFDAAPHMEYRHENKTRLEVAQRVGPVAAGRNCRRKARSPCFDTAAGPGGVRRPIAALAKQRIERLETVANSQPLAAGRRGGRSTAGPERAGPQEIYVFTDLRRAAWPSDAAAALQDRLTNAARRERLPDRRGRQGAGRFRPGRSAALAPGALQPRRAGLETDLSLHRRRAGERTVELHLGRTANRGSRRPSRCRPRRVAAGRVPRRAGWTRARTRAACGSSARTAWPPTTPASSPSRSSRPGGS